VALGYPTILQALFLAVLVGGVTAALLLLTRRVKRTLDLDPLLTQIADTLFNVFRQADRCFVIMLEESGRPIPKVVKNRRARQDDTRFSRTIVKKTIDQMESYLSEDASSDIALGPAASIAEFKIRSVMCVPLATPDGKAIGAAVRARIKERAAEFAARTGVKACLATVLVGDDPASRVYVRNKGKGCIEAGMLSRQIDLPASTPEGQLLDLVPVAHPGAEAPRHSDEQRRGRVADEGRRAILGALGFRDATAQVLRRHLEPVADSEQRLLERIDTRVRARRRVAIAAGGRSGEDALTRPGAG
jgi:hypothetical protein